jgi:15-cis-phytoene synthase
MSDKAIPQNLASAETFDARLKALDEARWVAARYAAPDRRRLLVVVHLVRAELLRAASAAEPMIGKIRLQWWRESLQGVAAGAARRHDLTLEIAACAGADDLQRLQAMVDACDDVVDDHLAAGGHQDDAQHARRHASAEAASLQAAAGALGVLRAEDGVALGTCAAAYLAARGASDDAAALWRDARAAARTLAPALWPAIAHLAVHAPGRAPAGPLGMRWRILKAIATRQL